MASKKYSNLQALLSGWLHQDFDVIGDSISDVVAEFKRVSPRTEALLVVAEIKAFISTCEDHVDVAFHREFDLEIEPTAFAPSVKTFLMQIADQLASE